MWTPAGCRDQVPIVAAGISRGGISLSTEAIGGLDLPPKIIVTDGDVMDVRVVARPLNPQ
jgi:hypothetical protein